MTTGRYHQDAYAMLSAWDVCWSMAMYDIGSQVGRFESVVQRCKSAWCVDSTALFEDPQLTICPAVGWAVTDAILLGSLVCTCFRADRLD